VYNKLFDEKSMMKKCDVKTGGVAAAYWRAESDKPHCPDIIPEHFYRFTAVKSS
jgi:hypothetical protein